MLSLGVKINVSLQALAQLLVVIGAGTWLAKRHDFGKKAIAAVSSVNWHACIPALLFSSIVAAIDAQRLSTLWPLLVFSLLHVAIGATVALLLGLATRLPRDLLFYTVMAGAVPNSGNLPWLVLPVVVRQLPLQGSADSNAVYTTGLVSVYTIMIMLVILTVPFIFGHRPRSSPGQREAPADLPASSHQQQQQQPPHHHQQQQQQGPVHIGAAASAASGVPPEVHPPLRSVRVSACGAAAAATAAAAAPASTVAAEVRLQLAAHPPACDNVAGSGGVGGGVVGPRTPDADAPCLLLDASKLQQEAEDQSVAPDVQQHPQQHPSTPQQQAGLVRRWWAAIKAPGSKRSSWQQQDQHLQLPERAPGAPTRSNSYIWARLGSFRSGSQLYMGAGQEDLTALGRVPSSAAIMFCPGQGICTGSGVISGRHPAVTLAAAGGLAGTVQQQEAVTSNRPMAQQQQQHQRRRQPQQQLTTGRPQRACGGLCIPFPAGAPSVLHVLQQAAIAFLRHPIVNRPNAATLCALAVAAVTPVRDLFVQELQPLNWLFRSFSWIGAACAPLACIQMGGELVQAPGEEAVHISRLHMGCAISIAIVVKLVLVPLVNVALLQQHVMGWLLPPGDPVYRLVLLLEGAVPGAVTLLVVCMRVYPDIAPLSQVLFWQYVASIVTLPCMLVWFISLVEATT